MLTPRGLPPAIEGLLTKVNDAVVSVQGYIADNFWQGGACREEDLDNSMVYGPDGMPQQAAMKPRVGEAPIERLPGEVTLECIHAIGVDLLQMPRDQRMLPLSGGDGRWMVGRQAQPDLFMRLVPDEALRVCISRCHFELLRTPAGTLCLRKHAQNPVLVNGVPMAQETAPISQGAHLGCCTPSETMTPFLIFRVHIQDSQEKPGQWQREQQQTAAPQTAWQQQAQQQQMQQQQQMRHPQQAQWKDPMPSAPYSLVCLSATGADPSLMLREAKTIGVHAHEPLLVGRQHQTGFFESLLGSDQRFLTIIGRTHFELAPFAGRQYGEQAGTFKLTNLSANPIALGQHRLEKGQHCVVRPPACIMFIASKTSNANDAYPFMTLNFEPNNDELLHNAVSALGAAQLETSPSILDSPSAAHGMRGSPDSHYMAARAPSAATAGMQGAMLGVSQCSAAMPALRHAGATEAQDAASVNGSAASVMAAMGAASWQAGGTSLPTSPLPPASAASAELAMQQQQPLPSNGGRSVSWPTSVPSVQSLLLQEQQASLEAEAGPCGEEAAFCLELGGTAVRPGAAASALHVRGQANGLVVGRLHQTQLLGEALMDGAAQYVSREHFRIERNMLCGGFNLVPLSTNLLWLSRGGQRAEAKRNEHVALAHGDIIQLYTGASDYSPDGPGCRGTLYWIFYDLASMPGGTNRNFVDDTVQVGLTHVSVPSATSSSMHIPATAVIAECPAFGAGREQHRAPGCALPPTQTGAGWTGGWEHQLPVPGMPGEPRPAPMFGGATVPNSWAGGRAAGFNGASSNTYYEKAITD